jgi:hypothetical protein
MSKVIRTLGVKAKGVAGKPASSLNHALEVR